MTSETGGKLKVYQLPKNQYRFVQEVRARLGAIASIEVQCILGRQIIGFHNLRTDELEIIYELAKVHGVDLP